MSTRSGRSSKWAYAAAAVLAAIGAVLGAVAYFGTETGVEGTTGALLAFLGAVAVAVGSAIRMARLPRVFAGILDVLLVIGAVLTAFAAWMLMQYLFTGAMVLSLLCILAAFVMPQRESPA